MRSNIVRTESGASVTPLSVRARCQVRLLRALGGFEERRDLFQTIVSEACERRHRRAGVDARRALEVRDLEGDALVLRAFGGQLGGAEVGAAVAVVGVTIEAARNGEQVCARDR